MVFQTATPGLLSLTKPVAEMRAFATAVNEFPLGQGLGEMYFGVFSTDLDTWQVVATGIVLAMIASVVTTFAGVIIDPVTSHDRHASASFISPSKASGGRFRSR